MVKTLEEKRKKSRECMRVYRQRNPDLKRAKNREHNKTYRQRHPDWVIAAYQRYRKRHPERIKRNRMKYNNKKSPERRWHSNDNYRFGGMRSKVFERDGYKCCYCGITQEEHKKRFKRDLSIDHIDGRGYSSKPPNNVLSNLQTLCTACHGNKEKIVYDEMQQLQTRLIAC